MPILILFFMLMKVLYRRLLQFSASSAINSCHCVSVNRQNLVDRSSVVKKTSSWLHLLFHRKSPQAISPSWEHLNQRNCASQNRPMSSTSTSETKGSADSSEKGNKAMSKKALKRQARSQQYKELKKRRKAQNLVQTGREDAGYNLTEFDKTSYYFENGLRKVYPYHYVFATYAKGRWVGRTLKNVLENEFGFDEPEDVDKAFHGGKIHVNGLQASVDYVVKDCDYISHQIHRHENPVTDRPLEIIADTEDVVVINKPSSIPCHPCGRYRFNSVVFILGKEMDYSNLRNIYRLDRLTSGVLIIGKTAEATKTLEDQVLHRQVQKKYVCRVMGEFPGETLTVDQPLQALSNKLRLQVVAPMGKSSQTTFTRLSYNGRSSVVRCEPRTGRTHQIRVHLQYLGHPIINDVFYNSDAWGPNKGKGGVYEVPNHIVCATIMKRHQATQWEGGENPHFHQKLKEQQQQESNSIQDQEITVSATISQAQSASTIVEKNIETDANLTSSLKEDKSLSPSKTQLQEDSSLSAANNSVQESEEELLASNNGVVNSSSVSSSHPSPADDDCTSKAQAGNGFDWSKWQVESSCDMCRKTTLDPKPRDLVMFLHAWKYKGPDWEYQTELPDWAREDWQDEDRYMLETTTMTDDEPDQDDSMANSVKTET